MDSSKNMAARGRGLFSLYIYIENFKNLLVRNHSTDFNIILQKCSFGDGLPRLFKPFGFAKNMAARRRGLFSLYIYIENFKNLLVRHSWIEFIVTWQDVALVTFYQDCSSPHDTSKNMGARGGGRERGLFSVYYLYRKILKFFLSEITWPISILLGRNVALVTLYQDCSSNHDSSKNMAARGGLIFPIYLNRKL